MRYHVTLIRMALIVFKKKITSVDDTVEKVQPLYITDRNVKV